MVINMNIGGTEKALLNMIKEMPKEEYDITLLMLEKKGGFLESVPDYVTITEVESYSTKLKPIIQNPLHHTAFSFLKNKEYLNSLIFLLIYLYSKLSRNNSLLYKYIVREIHCSKIKYDIAIAYAGPMDFISYFIINKVNAKKKLQWIHFDITKIGFNQIFANNIYRKFSKIYVVSNEGRNKLVRTLPKLENKIEVFLNRVSKESVLAMANRDPGFTDDYNGMKILTVGRLSKEKGQDLTIPVLAKLKQEGFNVRWYCIGDGNARPEYEAKINEYNLKDDFILLGSYPNPYPFMKQCDIYVQPSRHEGYCITLAEAKCFNKPIVSTNFTGANDQLTHGKTGLIVDVNSEEIYLAIWKLITDKMLSEKIRMNLNEDIGNKETLVIDL